MDNVPTLNERSLELLGLKEKDIDVYIAVLKLGGAPLRRIAESAGMKRGTVYDALKTLKSAGLVSYLDEKRHRYFVAEDPQKLRGLATRREVAIQEARQKIDRMIPELRSLIGSTEYRPSVRYFEGERGVKDMLEDVLYQTKKQGKKTYRVYSSSGIRDLIAAAWPAYNTARKKNGVRVKAIAIGAGGKTHGLDERKWLSQKDSSPMYTFIYADRTAFVGIDKNKQLFGVMIDDAAIAQTQRLIFDSLWQNLS